MELNWRKSGILLGITFFLAVLLVKPIGVSTQFVILDAIIWDQFNEHVIEASETAKSGFSSINAYLNKSGGKYAAAAAEPLNYSFVFVLAMVLGAFISAQTRRKIPADEQTMPPVWRKRFGNSAIKRYAAAFVAGFVVLYGARLAGGCTSGHMMSGMMQTAVSGYLFALGAFAVGIPVAIFTFRKGGK